MIGSLPLLLPLLLLLCQRITVSGASRTTVAFLLTPQRTSSSSSTSSAASRKQPRRPSTTTHRWAEPVNDDSSSSSSIEEPVVVAPTVAAVASPVVLSTSQVSTTASPATSSSAEYYVRCGRCQTYYSIVLEDFGLHRANSKGCRFECTVCQHSWFQSKDRILTLRDGFELIPLPPHDLERIALNLQEGKPASFTGQVKLYVGNIAFECREDDIYQLFAAIGSVGDVSLVRDEAGKMRGFGFVTMRSKEEGQLAVEKLDGSSLRGRNLAVRESNN